MWVTQAWFPKLFQMLIQNPFRLPVTQKLLRLAHNNQYHPINKRKIRHQLKNKRLSRKSIQYIKKSWRISTNRKYEFIWYKWHIWCSQREINPMQPTEIDFIQYLSELADKKIVI